jgi:uncharacterized membrane protein YbhN (UPF0104 family)
MTVGSAVNNLVPLRAGDAVRLETARQATGAPRLAIAKTLVSERILDGLVLALLVVTGALLSGLRGTFLWVGIAVAAAIVVALPFLVSRHVLAPVLALSAGIWFADVVMYGALARGLHLDASIGAILLIVGVGNLALAIPGPAAGLGSFELVTLAGAHGIGIGGHELAGFVLAVHAVIVLPPTLTGLALLPKALRGHRGVVAHR